MINHNYYNTAHMAMLHDPQPTARPTPCGCIKQSVPEYTTPLTLWGSLAAASTVCWKFLWSVKNLSIPAQCSMECATTSCRSLKAAREAWSEGGAGVIFRAASRPVAETIKSRLAFTLYTQENNQLCIMCLRLVQDEMVGIKCHALQQLHS